MTLDTPEHPSEEPTPTELAEACRGILDDETCDEIAATEDLDLAESHALGALEEIGVDVDEFLKLLKEKGFFDDIDSF